MAREDRNFEVLTTRAELHGVPPESDDDLPFDVAAEQLEWPLPD